MPRRGLDALVLPGKFLVDKLTGLKKQQQEQSRRKVTERELAHLHHKIVSIYHSFCFMHIYFGKSCIPPVSNENDFNDISGGEKKKKKAKTPDTFV